MKIRPVAFLVFACAAFAMEVSLAAGNFKRLSATQIRAKFTGIEMTDNVHWRDVYRRDGALLSYSMGVTRTGRWRVEDNQLCLDLETQSDSGCYEVWVSGNGVELRPVGPGLTVHGVVEKPVERN
jgi:hypothetical protein